jgi:hypothetical protein
MLEDMPPALQAEWDRTISNRYRELPTEELKHLPLAIYAEDFQPVVKLFCPSRSQDGRLVHKYQLVPLLGPNYGYRLEQIRELKPALMISVQQRLDDVWR